MSQNLKYLKQTISDPLFFSVILNEYAEKHNNHIKRKIALSLLEFFNSGKYIDDNLIKTREINGKTNYYILI